MSKSQNLGVRNITEVSIARQHQAQIANTHNSQGTLGGSFF
jgi:hypothetical protein